MTFYADMYDKPTRFETKDVRQAIEKYNNKYELYSELSNDLYRICVECDNKPDDLPQYNIYWETK